MAGSSGDASAGSDGPVPPQRLSPGPAPAPSPSPSIVFNPFTVGGFTYSADPVFRGTITGFGWGPAGFGVSDGEAGPARVWYGTQNCATFRVDGTGVLDLKGGSATTIDSFPHVSLLSPGSVDALPPSMRGFSRPIQQHLDPAYDRRSELKPFRWGVRMRADGRVHTDSRGHYLVVMRFDDGSTMANGWDPVSNAPSSSLSSGDTNLITGEQTFFNAFRAHVNAPPANSHFCRWRERTSIQLQPRCIDTPNVTAGDVSGATRRLCYDRGMLQGEYQLTAADGRMRESGFFEDNRPVDGWGFWWASGSQRASGDFTKSGVPTGEWTFRDASGRVTSKVPFTGVYGTLSSTAMLRVLDGVYTEYSYGTSRVYESGRVLSGHKDGPWKTDDSTTLPSNDGTMITSESLWDAGSLTPAGTFCVNKDCVTRSTPRLLQIRTYKWVNTCPYPHPWMQEVRYGADGRATGKTCYRIDGTPKSSTVTALPSCPTVSCQ